jgi:hypothetical protein
MATLDGIDGTGAALYPGAIPSLVAVDGYGSAQDALTALTRPTPGEPTNFVLPGAGVVVDNSSRFSAYGVRLASSDAFRGAIVAGNSKGPASGIGVALAPPCLALWPFEGLGGTAEQAAQDLQGTILARLTRYPSSAVVRHFGCVYDRGGGNFFAWALVAIDYEFVKEAPPWAIRAKDALTDRTIPLDTALVNGSEQWSNGSDVLQYTGLVYEYFDDVSGDVFQSFRFGGGAAGPLPRWPWDVLTREEIRKQGSSAKGWAWVCITSPGTREDFSVSPVYAP